MKITVDFPEELWTAFSVKVIKERGGRKKGVVIKELVREWVKR
jgi:metal-responsive CopG/Arc/MetJ family transcriptional regulator